MEVTLSKSCKTEHLMATLYGDTIATHLFTICKYREIRDAVEAHSCVDIVAKFTDEQYTTIN